MFEYVAVDTEGFAPDLLGISIAHPGLKSMYFPTGHREDVNVDDEVLSAIRRTLLSIPYRIFHNAAHDLVALPYLFNLPFICTMIMGHMVDENVMSKSLDFMHKWYTKKEGKIMHPLMASIIKTPGLGWYHVPFELMNEYADNDALITMELFLTLLPLYEEQFGSFWSEDEEFITRLV